jgi:hypothetical protein
MVGRIFVEIAGRHHERVLTAKVADMPGDVGHDLGPSGNGQGAPFHKVVLEIHDQQGIPHIGDSPPPRLAVCLR